MPGRHPQDPKDDIEAGREDGHQLVSEQVNDPGRRSNQRSSSDMKRSQSRQVPTKDHPSHARRRSCSLTESAMVVGVGEAAGPTAPPSLAKPRQPQLMDRLIQDGKQVLMLLAVFGLLTGGLSGFGNPPVAAMDRATQVHLAQGRDPSEMTVSFITASASLPFVQYGLSEKSLTQRSSAEDAVTRLYTFNAYDQKGPYTSPLIHHVRLIGLKPDTQYHYVLRDGLVPLVSPMFSFRTLPAVGTQAGPVTFAVLADLGVTRDAEVTLQHVMSEARGLAGQGERPSMVLHAGDLSYADCVGSVWDDFGNMIEPIASTMPWMVGPGNHEVEQQPGTKELYVPYEHRYRMPWVKPAQFGDVLIQGLDDDGHSVDCAPVVFLSEYDYGNSFYSFRSGLSHLIFLNPYTRADPKSEQYKWLVAELKTVDRKQTPWLVIVTHCPPYNSNVQHKHGNQVWRLREHMEPLFYGHRVNLVIAGHVHAYERSHPVFGNKTVSDGVTYVVIGDGGNAEGHASNYEQPQPEWSAFRDGTQYGHATWTVANATHARWMWHRNVDGVKTTKDDAWVCNAAVTGSARCGGSKKA